LPEFDHQQFMAQWIGAVAVEFAKERADPSRDKSAVMKDKDALATHHLAAKARVVQKGFVRMLAIYKAEFGGKLCGIKILASRIHRGELQQVSAWDGSKAYEHLVRRVFWIAPRPPYVGRELRAAIDRDDPLTPRIGN